MKKQTTNQTKEGKAMSSKRSFENDRKKLVSGDYSSTAEMLALITGKPLADIIGKEPCGFRFTDKIKK